MTSYTEGETRMGFIKTVVGRQAHYVECPECKKTLPKQKISMHGKDAHLLMWTPAEIKTMKHHYK